MVTSLGTEFTLSDTKMSFILGIASEHKKSKVLLRSDLEGNYEVQNWALKDIGKFANINRKSIQVNFHYTTT